MSAQTDKSETIYIGCECHATEHIIRISYFDWSEKDEPEIYFELQSDGSHLGFWQRLKMAVNFIFFRRHLEWHDVIPAHKDLANLDRVLKNYHADYALWEKKNSNGN